MELNQTTIDISMNGKSIYNNKYKEARRRICRHKGIKDISDVDIIEALVEEIDYYRNRIQFQEKLIKELSKDYIKDTRIECESKIYSCGIDEGDKDYQVISYYDNGELIKQIIKPINSN